MRSYLLGALSVLVVAGACSSGSGATGGTGASAGLGGSGSGGSGGSAGSGGSGADGGNEICNAKLTWLQKDAYKETAGRSSDLWPPHTTTTLEIECNGTVVRSAFRENHGTKPGEVDKNGDVFLVDVGSMQASGPHAELDALANAYEACECGTKFLSLDALGDAAVQQLVKEISDYIAAHLTCTGPVDAAGLVQKLQQGEIEGVLAVLPNCTWQSGSDWSGGFDAALQAIIASANEALADYHVCNNDAELQTTLFDAYRQSATLGTCDGGSALCHGPKWFYAPKP